VPREECLNANLTQYVSQNSFPVVWSRFSEKAWSLEPPAVEELMQKIKQIGIPLKDFVNGKTYRGILTGLNEVFIIDGITRQELIRTDPNCIQIIKPYLRGRDLRRWTPESQDVWLICTHSGIKIDEFPSVEHYLQKHRAILDARSSKPEWYQLSSPSDNSNLYEQGKIIWQDLAFHSRFCFDDTGLFVDNTCFLLPSSDLYLLGVLNSPLIWIWMWRNTIHGKDEVLRLKSIYMEVLPIAQPTPTIRAEVEEIEVQRYSSISIEVKSTF
jgi:hypothetical protein